MNDPKCPQCGREFETIYIRADAPELLSCTCSCGCHATIEHHMEEIRHLKYFLVRDPYFALIAADNQEEAQKLYSEQIADSAEDITEITRDYALIMMSRVKNEDGQYDPIEEVMVDLDTKGALLCDGSLL